MVLAFTLSPICHSFALPGPLRPSSSLLSQVCPPSHTHRSQDPQLNYSWPAGFKASWASDAIIRAIQFHLWISNYWTGPITPLFTSAILSSVFQFVFWTLLTKTFRHFKCSCLSVRTNSYQRLCSLVKRTQVIIPLIQTWRESLKTFFCLFVFL